MTIRSRTTSSGDQTDLVSARAILEALACNRSECVCNAGARRGRGLTHCPAHDDRTPSLSVNEKSGVVLVHCHAGCSQEAVIDALQERSLWSESAHRYSISDHIGKLRAVHARDDRPDGTKRMLWQGPDGRLGLNGTPVADLPLFGIDELNGTKSVVIAEGEKARNALASQEIPAVATVTGAKSIPSDEALRPLLGHQRIVLWADNDDAGREHMDRVAARLVELGHGGVRIVFWPDAPNKGDAADFVERRPERAAIVELLRTAQAWKPRATAPPAVNLVTIASVQPEAVRWFWRDRIPYDGMTLWDGDPGLGKTAAALDLIARQTTGQPMPDGTPSDGPSDVVILTVEDVLATTIRPRLEAAGADLTRVHAITGVPDGDDERPIVLPGDWTAIIAAIEMTGARLGFLDPLMALLGGDVNSYRDQDVRRALVPGIRAAERLGFALLVTRHLNKSSSTNALYRGGGSIGLIGAARSAMLAAQDPDDETGERRILAMTKHNLAKQTDALVYTIEETTIAGDIGTVRIVWHGASQHHASDLLATRDGSGGERTALDEAMEFLRFELADGPIPAGDIQRARRAAGISEATARRAKEALGVKSKHIGNPKHGGYWAWVLPNSLGAHSTDSLDEYLEHENLENRDNDGKSSRTIPLGADIHRNGHLEPEIAPGTIYASVRGCSNCSSHRYRKVKDGPDVCLFCGKTAP